MEPPPRSLALDAHYCIMVRVPWPTEYKYASAIGCACWRAPLGIDCIDSVPTTTYDRRRNAEQRRTDGLRVPWVETRTWSSFKQATRSNDLNQRLDRNHPIQVLGGEIEVAGAEFLDPPLDLVHARPPARHAAAAPVHDPLCPVRLIGIAQPAKVSLAHAQQGPCFTAAQLPRLMQPNRIDDPGHSDLRQHAIPPAKTGQIVCSPTVAEVVPPVAGETAGAMISSGGERPSGFWWARPRYQTWPTGCCGLESGDAKAIPVRKLILSRGPAPPT